MKLFFCLLFIPTIIKAQKLDPIWKLKWKMDIGAVVRKLNTEKNIMPYEIKGDSTFMAIARYKTQNFDGHKAAFISLFFFQNKFLRSEIFFENSSKNDEQLFLLFDSIKTILATKYFEPQFCETADTYKGTTEKLKAIKAKASLYYCNWF